VVIEEKQIGGERGRERKEGGREGRGNDSVTKGPLRRQCTIGKQKKKQQQQQQQLQQQQGKESP